MKNENFKRKETKSVHIPVLKNEVLKYLAPKPNENFIDCTIGEGGHAIAILRLNKPNGKVLGIDKDQKQIENCKIKTADFKERLILVCDNFANLKEIVKRKKFAKVSGVLFDLGLSSWHLEKSGRGFSFQRDEPLIMCYDEKQGLTAKKILNEWPESEIEKILKDYGEERFAKKISKKIIEERKKRKIETTSQLVNIIEKAVPHWYKKGKIHFATRTFQALRIVINDELENLKKGLMQAIEVLKNNGKLVVISFHSLEDRIVKNFLKSKEKEGVLKILTKKPIIPSNKEKKENPRSRSAKLRAAIKIS